MRGTAADGVRFYTGNTNAWVVSPWAQPWDSDSGRSVVPQTAAEGELVPEGHPDEKRAAE